MRTDLALTRFAATLVAASVALSGCDADSVVLFRSQDGGPDASEPATVTVEMTGFDEHAGLTVYGKLGIVSGIVVSAVIGGDAGSTPHAGGASQYGG